MAYIVDDNDGYVHVTINGVSVTCKVNDDAGNIKIAMSRNGEYDVYWYVVKKKT